ncbi:D-alanyl-D-alanine carboxypeptidase [Salinibacillus kushneri]|uniref:D-alanyl-D-alanine carboxypeptidase n=1 Tax=Salinibacillus kushneri TaxID=237682 RepID=A0A1I0AWN4_9BACI|nr:M15 family metallopeptidase [Salinibacillus kushneri]SES97989.1 D-alanyl-D-alanine carboxypeptidase [Salinibacillus kushneri]
MKIKPILAVLMMVIMVLTACQSKQASQGDENDKASNSEQVKDKKNEQKADNQEGNKEEENIAESEKENDSKNENKESAKEESTAKKDEEPDQNGIVTISDPTAIDLVVNKQRKLPDGFEPPNLVEPNVPFSFDKWREKRQIREVAAGPLEELFKGAEKAGVDLVAVSGYRSYQRQETIYNYNVETKGLEHANKYSAKPGHSEHQTGLTMDVSSAGVSFNLVEDFRDTPEGDWLADHAHEYGFIIRYPKGDADITGYSYEPWHIRYVGKEMAKEIHEQQTTLEEFFGLYTEEKEKTNQ